MQKAEMIDLTPFCGGSERIYPYTFGSLRIGVITDGAKYIADECKAFWFIDLIMSYQTAAFKANNPFQVWIIKSDGKGGAIAECEDGNENHVLTQKIGFTDFPFERVEDGIVKMWFTDDTLLLPCEY
jgi:hypothetical protein